MAKKKGGVAISDDYAEVFESLKSRVRQLQTKAMLSVNRERIQLYWDIGRQIVQRQQDADWGRSVVDRLSKDLRSAFPDVTGFSASSLWRTRAFCLAYQDLVQPVRVSDQPPEALLTLKGNLPSINEIEAEFESEDSR